MYLHSNIDQRMEQKVSITCSVYICWLRSLPEAEFSECRWWILTLHLAAFDSWSKVNTKANSASFYFVNCLRRLNAVWDLFSTGLLFCPSHFLLLVFSVNSLITSATTSLLRQSSQFLLIHRDSWSPPSCRLWRTAWRVWLWPLYLILIVRKI